MQALIIGLPWVVVVLLISIISAIIVTSLRNLPEPLPTSIPLTEFSEDRADIHLNNLQSLSPRPANAHGNHEVSDYIISFLRGLEYELRQTHNEMTMTIFDHHDLNATRTVPGDHSWGVVDDTNIGVFLTWHNQTNAEGLYEAVLVNAHYDSVWSGPGVGDDGSGVAVLLEILQNLVHSALEAEEDEDVAYPTDLFVLFNNAEELWRFVYIEPEECCLGSRVFVRSDPAATYRVRVVGAVNLDSAGTSGRHYALRTNHPDILRAYTDGTQPMGTAIVGDIVRSGLVALDSDYSVFHHFGVPAVEIGLVHDHFSYHTDRDSTWTLHDFEGTIQLFGEDVLTTIKNLLSKDPESFPDEAMAADAVIFQDNFYSLLIWESKPTRIVVGVFCAIGFFIISCRAAKVAKETDVSALSCLGALGTVFGLALVEVLLSLVLVIIVALLMDAIKAYSYYRAAYCVVAMAACLSFAVFVVMQGALKRLWCLPIHDEETGRPVTTTLPTISSWILPCVPCVNTNPVVGALLFSGAGHCMLSFAVALIFLAINSLWGTMLSTFWIAAAVLMQVEWYMLFPIRDKECYLLRLLLTHRRRRRVSVSINEDMNVGLLQPPTQDGPKTAEISSTSSMPSPHRQPSIGAIAVIWSVMTGLLGVMPTYIMLRLLLEGPDPLAPALGGAGLPTWCMALVGWLGILPAYVFFAPLVNSPACPWRARRYVLIMLLTSVALVTLIALVTPRFTTDEPAIVSAYHYYEPRQGHSRFYAASSLVSKDDLKSSLRKLEHTTKAQCESGGVGNEDDFHHSCYVQGVPPPPITWPHVDMAVLRHVDLPDDVLTGAVACAGGSVDDFVWARVSLNTTGSAVGRLQFSDLDIVAATCESENFCPIRGKDGTYVIDRIRRQFDGTWGCTVAIPSSQVGEDTHLTLRTTIHYDELSLVPSMQSYQQLLADNWAIFSGGTGALRVVMDWSHPLS